MLIKDYHGFIFIYFGLFHLSLQYLKTPITTSKHRVVLRIRGNTFIF